MNVRAPGAVEASSAALRRRVRAVVLAFFASVLPTPAVFAAPPLEAYGRLPGVEQMVLSPSGTRYAFVAVHGESRRLGVASFDSKLIYQVPIADRKLREIRWAGDAHVLATFSSTVNLPFTKGRRYELDAVAVVQPDDGSSFSVFQKAAGIAHTVLGTYGAALIDGRWFAYFGGITYARSSLSGEYQFSHGYPDLYRVDLMSGQRKLEARGSYDHEGWVLDAAGRIVAHAEYAEKTGRWQLYAHQDRKQLLRQKVAPLGEISLMGLGRRPATVLVLDTSGDEDVLSEIDVADGREQSLLDDDAVDGLLFDPQSRLLIGAAVADERRAVFFDERLQARFDATRKAFPGLQMALLSATGDLSRLLVKTDGGDDSGTFWLVDIATGKAEPVGYAYPQVRSADVAVTRYFRYPAADGLPIEGVLTLPKGRDPKGLPLVVMPHGGPIGVRDRVGFDWWAQAYASRGYAVLQPNYRGSSGYGRDFQRAGYGELGRRMLSDIADGVKAVAAEGIVDPRRVCIVGGSYGGYAALAGVTLQTGTYRCAVSVNGVADMAAFMAWRNSRSGYHSAASRFWRAASGADADSAVLREISPIRHAKHANAPVLLIHGRDDTVVPSSQSASMAAALRGADKPVELVMMDGEDHWLSREATRVETLRKSVDFVIRHNPPNP